MSRHGGGSAYDEREYYSREETRGAPPVRTRERDFEEDIYMRRESQPGRRPDFLRDDYGPQGGAGQMVVRERETETYGRPRRRSPSPEVHLRGRIVSKDRSPSIEERVRTNLRVSEREQSLSPPREQLRARIIETRERIPVRPRSPSPVHVRERERYVERRERSPSPARQETIHVTQRRETRRSPSPSIRSLSPAPPPPPIQAPPIHQEIITHHRHIDHGFERARVPTPPPPPRRSSPKIRETDIDIYQSRNNTEVDIHQRTTGGASRSRTPQPPSRRHDYYDDDYDYEQEREKLRVRDNGMTIARRRSISARPSPRNKVSIDIRDNESEADYYARKAGERAYIGEGYNGATKDWAIVDVPPGTERVSMEGVGGGAEEITWQKYNGVRRSKFISERERSRAPAPRPREPEPRRETDGLEIEISSRKAHGGGTYLYEHERIQESNDRRAGMPRGQKSRMGDMWTEITKDLVAKEAIEQMGYDYEETEFFYYVIQYLGYEDVLQLVQLSEKIRADRQRRLREIERERVRMEKIERKREEWERAERRRSRQERERPLYDDERIVEREIVYGSRDRHRGYR
ncbi:hypothetical protein BJ878DRAFT_555385 [Calycina marina]|uniref:DUF8035 domain-containing protein n=1 Tax=Calycina marina TaxID=1763456 RepID=A0A9P7YYV2_9HELO|nr:hypothetical protein BJ878DRAFT_555385 [Calycina marina]